MLKFLILRVSRIATHAMDVAEYDAQLVWALDLYVLHIYLQVHFFD